MLGGFTVAGASQKIETKEPSIGMVIEKSTLSAMVYGESDGQWQPVQRLIIRYFVDEISDGETPVSNWPFGEFIIDKIYVGERQADEEQYRCLHLRRKLTARKSIYLA